MLSKEVKEVLIKIGQYYLAKNEMDYQRTEDHLRLLAFSEVKINEDGSVSITTERPGLLIGKRGENIDDLSKYLVGMPIRIIEAQDSINDYLIPRDPYPQTDYEAEMDELYQQEIREEEDELDRYERDKMEREGHLDYFDSSREEDTTGYGDQP